MSAHDALRAGTSPGLAIRVFLAVTLVVLAGAATFLVVSVVVSPMVFRRYLEDAGVAGDSAVAAHIDQGFTIATLTSMVAGVVAASAVAAVVAVFIARRISEPVSIAADTATRLADGDYAARMPHPGLGPELDGLASAVNALAVRLERAEDRRRTLLADVAHELRTPLAALQATVESIADGAMPADAETLRTLTEQTARLTRLTEDLPAASRSDEHAFWVQPRPLDPAEVAEAAVAAHAARYLVADVALTHRSTGPATVHADPDRLTEVLDQLLDNALRHCAAGDTVTVHTAPRGDSVLLLVADTGRGFPPHEAEALFRRFHRADTGGAGGSGVGLTVARALVEAQGGTISASSPGPGRGATFTITLPARQ